MRACWRASAAVTREALVSFEAAALSGFDVVLCASCGWGHGALLCIMWLVWNGVQVAASVMVRAAPRYVTRSQDDLLSLVNHLR